MHDHPWDFATYVVRGGYKEQVPGQLMRFDGDQSIHSIQTNNRYVHENRWAKRRATQLHRVKLTQDYTVDQKDIAPMTVCFTGPTKRDWGFVKDGKWVFWKKYLGLPDDAPTRG